LKEGGGNTIFDSDPSTLRLRSGQAFFAQDIFFAQDFRFAQVCDLRFFGVEAFRGLLMTTGVLVCGQGIIILNIFV